MSGTVLQCVAVCCNVLQCVAVCCSVLIEESDDARQALLDQPPPPFWSSIAQPPLPPLGRALFCFAFICVRVMIRMGWLRSVGSMKL